MWLIEVKNTKTNFPVLLPDRTVKRFLSGPGSSWFSVHLPSALLSAPHTFYPLPAVSVINLILVYRQLQLVAKLINYRWFSLWKLVFAVYYDRNFLTSFCFFKMNVVMMKSLNYCKHLARGEKVEVHVDITSPSSLWELIFSRKWGTSVFLPENPITQILLPVMLNNNRKTKPKTPAIFRPLVWSWKSDEYKLKQGSTFLAASY